MLEVSTARRSPYQPGRSERSSIQERRIAAWLDEKIKLGECSLIDVSRTTLTQNFGPDRPASGARLFGRSNDIYVPQPRNGTSRHPVLTSFNGKPCLAFGCGGFDPNVLNNGLNGALRRASMSDAAGAEINDRAILKPGVGRTIWGKTLIPAVDSTVGGITWSAANGYVKGGTLLGGAGGATSLNVLIDGNGNLILANRRGITSAGGLNIGDGNVHAWMMTWNPVTGVGSIYVDGVAGGVVTSTVDVATTTGSNRMVVGGFVDGADISDRFGGIVFGLGYSTGTLGEDPAFRQDLFNYLNLL